MPHPGRMTTQKAKDFKGTMRSLLAELGHYKFRLIAVIVFAVLSTIFNIAGPKVLAKATTALATGWVAKLRGTGSIDFGYIGKILLILLVMYLVSAAFSFCQSWIMSGLSQKMCYDFRRQISEKINRLPLAYFEKRTVGEVLSRITNDVDTLGQSLNQSITQLITSVTTMIGVLIMMLSTIAAFRVFNEIYVLTNGSAGPGGMDMTMSMLIKREGTGIQARTGYASAISIVVLVIVGVMLIVQQILQKRGED